MAKTSLKNAKKLILDLITRPVVLEEQEEELDSREIKQLEFLVENGHWEVLIKNKVFRQLAPEGQVQTIVKAIENRLNTLRATLMPLGRSANTRDAYIQVLNHVHDMEKLQEEILKGFYASLGKRQIDKNSKGKKIYF